VEGGRSIDSLEPVSKHCRGFFLQINARLTSEPIRYHQQLPTTSLMNGGERAALTEAAENAKPQKRRG